MIKKSFSEKYLYPKKEDHILPYAFKALYRRYIDDNLSQMGGQLAYFFALSLFPLLILISQIIGFFDITISSILITLQGIFPQEILDLVIDFLEYSTNNTSQGVLTLGVLFTVYLASRAFNSLIFALNKAFRIDIYTTNMQKRILAYLVTFVLIVSLILSLGFVAVGKDIIHSVTQWLNVEFLFLDIWDAIRWTTVISALFITLSLIYNVIPFKNFPRRYTIVGTIFTMGLWLSLSIAFAYYVNNFSNYSVIYGSLGAVMLLLLYLYFAGIIIVLGAELTHILAMRHLGNFSYDVKLPPKSGKINLPKNNIAALKLHKKKPK